MTKSFIGVPSIYNKLLELRKSKTAKFKKNKYLKDSTVLRYYQVVGSLHMLLLERMVLGDGCGLGKCLLSSTYVPTTHGMVQISELAQPDMKEDTFCELPEDLFLLSQEGVVKPSSLYYSGVHDGLKVTSHRGYEVTGLSHHPILCCTENGIDFKRIDELKIGDYICINRKGLFSTRLFRIVYGEENHVHHKTYKMPEYIDEDLAELMGFYIAEGYSSEKQSFSITKHKDNLRNHIRGLFKKIFNYSETVLNKDYDKEVRVHSVEIGACFESLGIDLDWKAGDKQVPHTIFKSPKNVVRSFLRGYFECDGSVDESGTVGCSSKSEKLIHHIQLLLLNFGIVCRRHIKMVKVKNERIPYWILYFHGKNLVKFEEEIVSISERKKGILLKYKNKPKNNNIDIIPFGSNLLRESMQSIISYLRTLPEQKNFSIKGSGWKGLVGKNYKQKIERYLYKKDRLTYEGLKGFIDKIEELKLTSVVSNYQELKEIYDKNLLFDQITDISEVKNKKFYDFHVPEVHNFTGNGFINHNTVQVIATYTFLLQTDPTLKLLVICPKSAKFQWQEEFEKFTQGITTRVIVNKCKGLKEGYESRMHQYESFKENVFIINYAPTINEYETIRDVLSPNYMMIIDEVTAIKNRKAKANFSCKYLAEESTRAYGLSATIIKNGLEEVWGIYSAVVPGLFGNITNFKKKFCTQELMNIRVKGKNRMIPRVTGYKNLKVFKETLDPYFLLRRKEEVASELPKLISKKVTLDMLPMQRSLYKQALSGIFYEERVRNEYFDICDQIRNGDISPKIEKRHNELKEKYEQFLSPDGKKRGKLAAITYCQMISNGPFLVNEPGESSKEIEFLRLMKEELLLEKVILFTRFKSGIPVLESICEKNYIKYTKIHGDLNDYERQKARQAFQNDPTCNLLFMTTAGSEALNLQAAGVIVFYDTPWSYGALAQIIGRAQRIGSTQKSIFLIHMVNRNTIDVRVINKVSGKKDLSDEVLGDTTEGALDFTEKKDSVVDDLYEDLLKDAKGL